jgi:hypothetical protein
MSAPDELTTVEGRAIAPLAKIVERNQVWGRMTGKYGVENPVPPWKTSLDGMCDALGQSRCDSVAFDALELRNQEDELSATVYADLPYPENRLVALAHSLLVRGLIDETELEQRLAAVRARLEA